MNIDDLLTSGIEWLWRSKGVSDFGDDAERREGLGCKEQCSLHCVLVNFQNKLFPKKSIGS